jgi:hypothetical protein
MRPPTPTSARRGNRHSSGIASCVEADPARPQTKRIVLRSRGRQMRDAYGPTTAVVEQQWRAAYGAGTVDALRAAVTPLVTALDADALPHYPPVLLWLMRRPLRGVTV